MQDDFLEPLEPTPILTSKKCKLIALCIEILLKYSTLAIAVIVLYMYDLFFAFLSLGLSYLIVGIIRSKLRNSSIPNKQREHYYNDKDIATWFTKKEFCFGEDSKAELVV